MPEDEEDAGGEEAVEAKKPAVGPVTIRIGVFASATAARDAAQDILALLQDYQITDVDFDFCEVGPQISSNPSVTWNHSSTSLVPSLLPSASASLQRPGRGTSSRTLR